MLRNERPLSLDSDIYFMLIAFYSLCLYLMPMLIHARAFFFAGAVMRESADRYLGIRCGLPPWMTRVRGKIRCLPKEESHKVRD